MSYKFDIVPNYYNTKDRIYSGKELKVNPGLTVLVGCNGCGKSTLLIQIREQLKKDEESNYISFDNLMDGGERAIHNALSSNNMSLVGNLMISSEGERIYLNISEFAVNEIKSTVEQTSSGTNLFILLDAVDSGSSIDNIIELKEFLNIVIEDCKSKEIDCYIIVAANSYEMARGEICIDTPKLTPMEFPTYESYREYIIKRRKDKNKRYERVNK